MALTLRGKPGAVSAAELQKLKHWLENEANARSIKERLEDRLGMVIGALKSFYPHRERPEAMRSSGICGSSDGRTGRST